MSKISEEERVFREHQRQSLEEAFHLFDIDQSGCISLTELRDVLKSLGYNPTEKEIVQIMAQVWESMRFLCPEVTESQDGQYLVRGCTILESIV